ncbi:hypothetical protein [Bradymonas sediminis]|uniref:Uncharacterized protein n=1 Tax=Bradymonas sediminis TaxID=1548548 RepID=A0A2Z4FP64_9DELT|nr:hypothetical protein [Bradymonas sediminis]AWV90670.1 hypothetical protein DN745_15645 [Bradymonas sediminis]TDP62692.1 Alg9-like mannosyltransferase family protein [Bradymonas sediminis]
MLHSNDSPNARLIDFGVLTLMAVAGIFLRLHWGLSDDSIFHPDAIYQVLEPAHKLVYGYGLEAWEWEFGARNWALPGMLAGVLGAARLLGFEQPESYMMIVRGFVATIFCASAYPVYYLARQFSATRLLAFAAAALFLFNPAMIAVGYRTLSEVISTPFVLFGLMWALGSVPPGAAAIGREAAAGKCDRLWFVLGVSLVGIAVLFRLQNALFALALVLPWRFQAAQHARYTLGLGTLVFWALVYGLIDWITWGLPFASAGAYLHFNLVLNGSTVFLGSNPFFHYVHLFLSSMGGVGALLLALPLLAISRARPLFICAFLYLLAHSFFPHKELRFVISTVPILAVLSAVGIRVSIDRVRAAHLQPAINIGASVLVFGLVGAGIGRVPTLKIKDVGGIEMVHTSVEDSLFDHLGGLNRLLSEAGAREDICGLYLREIRAVETGGYSYFHRDVLFFHTENLPEAAGNYNYAISSQPPGAGWVEVGRNPPFVLYKTQPERCTPPTNYERSLIVLPPDEESAESE